MAGKPRSAKRVVVRIRAEDPPDEEGRCRWLARWTLNGERRSEALKRRMTPEEAAEIAADMEHRIRTGKTPSDALSSSWTVRDLVRFYLRDLTEQACTARHLANDADRLEQVVRLLGHLDVASVDQSDLELYVGRRRRDAGRKVKGRTVGGGRRGDTPARTTVQREIGVLLRAYRVAKRRKRITVDPPARPTMKGWPDDARPARRLTEAEVASLVTHAADVELGRLLTFLAWCPRRPVAVFGIRRKDCARVLDERLPRRERQLFVERDKGGVGRGWCPLTQPALDILLDHLSATSGSPDDLVWRSETGRPLTPALLWYPFRRAALAAGLADVQVYDLRKFGAVQVQAATADLEVTCQFTGHKDVRTLLRYLSAQRGVAEELAGSIGWSAPHLELVEGGGGEGSSGA